MTENKLMEDTLVKYLNENLCVPAYMEVPENPPSEYVVIEKTGGGSENGIFSASFAAQSCAKSLYRAAVINESVKAQMASLAQTPEVFAVELNSDYNFTDTSTKQYRYQAVFDIYY